MKLNQVKLMDVESLAAIRARPNPAMVWAHFLSPTFLNMEDLSRRFDTVFIFENLKLEPVRHEYLSEKPIIRC